MTLTITHTHTHTHTQTHTQTFDKEPFFEYLLQKIITKATASRRLDFSIQYSIFNIFPMEVEGKS